MVKELTGLGELLKEARKKKGYSLDDLQSITKIQKRYLSGIENEDYKMMPGSFYVRAFIKQYAEAVDLDPNEVLHLFKEEKNEEEVVPEEQPILTRQKIRTNNELRELLPKLIFAVFVIALIVIIYFFVVNSNSMKGNQVVNGEKDEPGIVVEQKDPPKTTPVPEKEPEEEVEEEPEPEPEVVAPQIEVVSSAGETTTFAVSHPEQLQLKIITTGDSWIGVRDESGTEIKPGGADVMKNGESLELDVTDKQSLRIRVGRTNATEIYINDQKIEYTTPNITQNIILQLSK